MNKKAQRKKRISFSKNDIYHITSRIYSMIQNNEKIILKKLHNTSLNGYYDEGTDEIVLDYRKELLPTFIHEVLHKWHKNWTEKMVRSAERKIINNLTQKQIKHIITALAEII